VSPREAPNRLFLNGFAPGLSVVTTLSHSGCRCFSKAHLALLLERSRALTEGFLALMTSVVRIYTLSQGAAPVLLEATSATQVEPGVEALVKRGVKPSKSSTGAAPWRKGDKGLQ